ncbi:hypothetical protein MUCCIDRAFT_154882 [Mucor lusitanicus CBS 277.49]|uniref:Uncharacterized protein n=1 Tax=Mucor lusitanicus CBS 277.49 TaxID=747725 RepID=A0A162R4Q6_MUCCL|nr:hypothetical protein MUCCIDRAFT_154882 [Mucor lusitanicus CBS 277.49]
MPMAKQTAFLFFVLFFFFIFFVFFCLALLLFEEACNIQSSRSANYSRLCQYQMNRMTI